MNTLENIIREDIQKAVNDWEREDDTHDMEVITDNKWKHFKYHYQLPAKMQEEFREEEYLDHWIKYKNEWYHLNDFMVAPDNLNDWDGIITETYFSGIVIKVSKDCESYIIGRVYA